MKARKSRQPRPLPPVSGAPSNIWIYGGLLILTLAAYAPVLKNGFVNYDDPDYVLDNPVVRAGITANGMLWALTTGHGANWFPLTWLSHMLDCQLFGLNASMHHFTSLLIHAAAALALFGFLREATGARWRSAFVAAAFALHPLHVESVAWVAERKDVLSALFWSLSLWAYVRYARRPSAARYAVVAVWFAAGLMSKPMVVTLPVIALLLDWWPLERFAKERAGRLLMEKLPLAVMAAAAAMATFVAQQRGGAVASLEGLPAALRLANVPVAYATYLVKLAWPSGLAPFYPFPQSIAWWQTAAAGLFVAAATVLALRERSRRYVAVGWLWFLVTLLPVIGIVQVGLQERADRYTYIPSIGIAIVAAWGAAELFERWKWSIASRAVAAGAACTAMIAATVVTAGYWRDSETLFRHAIAVTEGNFVAYNDLAIALQQSGRVDEAISDYRKAIEVRPRYPEAEISLSSALLSQGRMQEAAAHIAKGLELAPESPEAHLNDATLLAKAGQTAQAAEQYRIALKLDANDPRTHDGLGVLLTSQHENERAVAQFREAIRLKPEDSEAHYNLGKLLMDWGRAEEGVAELTAAVQLQPRDVEAQYNLGTALANTGHMDAAAEHFRAAVQLRPDFANAHFNLAGALAAMDRCEDATPEFAEALRLEPDFTAARQGLAYCSGVRGAK